MKDDTKDRIVLAAGPIFAEKGFKDATVREISEAADANLASINYYFGDKRNLYTQTVLRALELRHQQIPEVVSDAHVSPEIKLRNIVSTMLRRVVATHDEPWELRLITREILNPTEGSIETLSETVFRPFFENLLSVIDEFFNAPISESQRKHIGLSVIGQCMYYRFANEMIVMTVPPDELEEHFQIDQLAAHITSFSLGGIEALRKQLISSAV